MWAAAPRCQSCGRNCSRGCSTFIGWKPSSERRGMNMQQQLPPYAIVIGLDSLTGIQTARILHQHNIPVIGIAKDQDHFSCRTRVCKKILIADTDSFELIRVLQALAPTLEKKPVLF